VPHLEGGFLIQDRDAWLVARMKPGEAPRDNLAVALLRAAGAETDLEAVAELVRGMRRRGVQAVLDRLAPVLEARDANLFLLLDQFEELFRFHAEQKDRVRRKDAAEMVSLMLRLTEQRRGPSKTPPAAGTRRTNGTAGCSPPRPWSRIWGPFHRPCTRGPPESWPGSTPRSTSDGKAPPAPLCTRALCNR